MTERSLRDFGTLRTWYRYLLDVDVDYPNVLHDDHNDLPFLPEKVEQVSGKLVAHSGNRRNYIVHYLALKQALGHGLKLLKINRALKFKQSAWLKSYIDLNNEFRKQARKDFEKDQFKFYNNAVYGKTMESVKKRIDIRLVTSWEQAEKQIAKSNFKDYTIFNENFVAIQMRKTPI